jgi:hypothetical protein
MSHLLARPSMLPPSPIVMYTGAEGSFTGALSPSVMLYLMFDILSCKN